MVKLNHCSYGFSHYILSVFVGMTTLWLLAAQVKKGTNERDGVGFAQHPVIVVFLTENLTFINIF